MGAGELGWWLQEPLLDRLPVPDPAAIVVPGGIVLAVHTPVGFEPYRWYQAVALAWARYPTGEWGVLLAWEAMWRPADGRDRVGGRRGWFKFDRDRCSLGEPTRVPNPWGMAWWGRRLDSPMTRAVEAAIAELPEHLRERAARPAPPEELPKMTQA